MGFFSDLLSMAASEVTNAIMDGVNEAMNAQEEKARLIEELKEKYTGVAYSTLMSQKDYAEIEEIEIEAIKSVIEERLQLAKTICNSASKEIFSEFNDEALVEYYEKLLSNYGGAFPEEYSEKIVEIFQKELMARPNARRIYAQHNEDCYDKYDYDKINDILREDSIFFDEILKAEAKRELDYRDDIIEIITTDEIDDLNNDEFMEIYSLIRADKVKIAYDDYDKIVNNTSDFSEYRLYNAYFGQARTEMLKICEEEITANRKYLVDKFISEYCAEELEKYANYSDKKLKRILDFEKIEVPKALVFELEQYDVCDKIIASYILSQRGGE